MNGKYSRSCQQQGILSTLRPHPRGRRKHRVVDDAGGLLGKLQGPASFGRVHAIGTRAKYEGGEAGAPQRDLENRDYLKIIFSLA